MEQLKVYVDGAESIFNNAESLYEEAQVLGESGHFARAAVLHQISMEECSKVDTIGAVATSILIGHEVDERRLATAFRSHRAKNYTNAYFARTTDDEAAAQERGDREAARKAFKEFQTKFHNEVNAIKNAGLYVDFEKGKFIAPGERIDERLAIEFQAVNAYLLKKTQGFVHLLQRMVAEPEKYAAFMKGFVERIEELHKNEDMYLGKMEEMLMQEIYPMYEKIMTDGS